MRREDRWKAGKAQLTTWVPVDVVGEVRVVAGRLGRPVWRCVTEALTWWVEREQGLLDGESSGLEV